jgi:arylformamidase
VVLVSGVYDLRPLVHTSVNDVLGLDETAAADLSPVLHPSVGDADVVVAWGDNETDAFTTQSRGYADHVRADGLHVVELECSGRHHFDIVDDLADLSAPLGALTLG